MTKKIPVAEINKKTTESIVEDTLKNDPKNAYTILGLMVEKFGVKESEIASKPFNQWKKGMPTMYTKIRLSLEKLVKEGKVKKQKVSKAQVYWWIGEKSMTTKQRRGDNFNISSNLVNDAHNSWEAGKSGPLV